MKHLHFVSIWSTPLSLRMMRKWEFAPGELVNPHKISLNSPLQEVARPPPEKENHLKHTASLCTVTPQMEQTDFPPQIGVSWAGRNVIKVLHKIKKILWPLADRIFQIKLSPTSRPLKNIVFCSKPHFLQVIIPQLIQYAKIPLNAISHPMTSAKDLLPQNPRSFG